MAGWSKRIPFLLLLVLLVISCSRRGNRSEVTQPPPPKPYSAGVSNLFVIRAQSDGAQLSGTLDQYGLKLTQPLGDRLFLAQAKMAEGLSPGLLLNLKNETGIVFVEKVRYYRSVLTQTEVIPPSLLLYPTERFPSFLPNDPLFREGIVDYSKNPPEITPLQKSYLEPVSAEGAWDLADGTGVKVAVIDSGVFTGHEDLQLPGGGSRVLPSPASTHYYLDGATLKQDNNYSDELLITPGANGTFVAGIIGATMNNSLGMAGLAHEASLIAIKVGKYDSVSGGWVISDAELFVAIEHAVDEGAKVIVLTVAEPSQVGPLLQQALNDAEAAGILTVAPAGDSSQLINDTDMPISPAIAPNVLAVGGLDLSPTLEVNTRTASSNYGPPVDLGAPATAVITTDIRNPDPNSNPPTSGYRYFSGTASATAIVAGGAALLYSIYGDVPVSPSEIQTILTSTVDPWSRIRSDAVDQLIGPGRINLTKAVVQARLGASPAPPVSVSLLLSPPNPTTNQQVILTIAKAGGIPPFGLEIDWGDGSVETEPTFNPLQNQFSHSYVSPGAYLIEVKLTDRQLALGQDALLTIVNNPISAEIQITKLGPLKYLFQATLSNVVKNPNYPPNGVRFSWDFGDSTVSDQQNPIHDYPAAGTYTVKLRIGDARPITQFQSVLQAD